MSIQTKQQLFDLDNNNNKKEEILKNLWFCERNLAWTEVNFSTKPNSYEVVYSHNITLKTQKINKKMNAYY